ncbi:hypothetical protein RISK_003116 [Rhodopirellula islandica]|uniref:Uncharacterized protein n=1 Tax=Rhodopirellula islandica TaxID=595434 RepID=A0A0J1BE00_RHOIS|nr:hypothetical protein RISK_003116 [Rhodopirellula islandica]
MGVSEDVGLRKFHPEGIADGSRWFERSEHHRIQAPDNPRP